MHVISVTYFESSGGSGITLGAGRHLLSYYCDDNGKVWVGLAGKAVA
jgi:hypothetical protein